MVSFEKEPYSEVFNESSSDGLSICRLLHETDFYSVVKYIETKCYSSDSSHFRYSPEFMVKLVVLRAFRGQSFRKTIASLTTEDCKLLSAPKRNGHYLIPSPSTLHHFMRYRLDEMCFEEVIRIAGSQLARLSGEKEGIIDSTPLEASRYDRYADFNTHYNCKMYKGHIFHLGNYPIALVFSDGNDHDSTKVSDLINRISGIPLKFSNLFADGGYDSFQIHADIFYHLGVIPTISVRENAVIQDEGTEKRINHWVNKLWRKGGSINAKINEKLRFLYENGRTETVGMYLRNQSMMDPNFELRYGRRGDCERTHSHMKSILKFDVKNIRNTSKKFSILVNFFAYQILLLGHLQNGILPAQQFAHYY